MPKREHTTQQSYIDWLKSMGCVFYAPLIQDDTRDYISGQPLEQSNGSFSWDSNIGAYKFIATSSYNVYIAAWNNLNLDIDINNFGGSWMYEVRLANNRQAVPIVFGGRNFAQSVAPNQVGNNIWAKWATTIPDADGVTHRRQWWYVNGQKAIIPAGYDRGVNPTVFTPDAKIRIEVNNVGTDSAYINTQFYMRNVYIFNRGLSQDEIKQIQQIP